MLHLITDKKRPSKDYNPMQNLTTESIPADIQNLVYSYPFKTSEQEFTALCDLQQAAIQMSTS